jgi:hypothetical protein
VENVDFALLLSDEFDGSPIADPSVLFRHGGRLVTPIRKREGFYVFCGLGGKDIELEISRPHYFKLRRRIVENCLDPGNPVETVRLTRRYPGNFTGCEWVEGEAPPRSEVIAFAKEEVRLQPGEEKNRLTILGQRAGRLIGRRFAFKGKPFETFLLKGMPAPGVFLADRNLDEPAETGAERSLLRAYLSRTGCDGRYHIPVEAGRAGKITGAAYYDGGEGKWVYL